MPWKPKDAVRHTKKANTPARAKMWAEEANRVYEKTGDDGTAVRKANSAVKKRDAADTTLKSWSR